MISIILHILWAISIGVIAIEVIFVSMWLINNLISLRLAKRDWRRYNKGGYSFLLSLIKKSTDKDSFISNGEDDTIISLRFRSRERTHDFSAIKWIKPATFHLFEDDFFTSRYFPIYIDTDWTGFYIPKTKQDIVKSVILALKRRKNPKKRLG